MVLMSECMWSGADVGMHVDWMSGYVWIGIDVMCRVVMSECVWSGTDVRICVVVLMCEYGCRKRPPLVSSQPEYKNIN